MMMSGWNASSSSWILRICLRSLAGRVFANLCEIGDKIRAAAEGFGEVEEQQMLATAVVQE